MFNGISAQQVTLESRVCSDSGDGMIMMRMNDYNSEKQTKNIMKKPKQYRLLDIGIIWTRPG